MKIQSIGRSMSAAALLTGVVLLNGCCTKKSESHAQYQYYSDSTTAAGGTSQSYQSSSGQGSSEDNVSVPLYKESLVVGKREVDAGSVRIKKIVKTETVNQPVELRREEIVIEREPASAQSESQMSADNAFQEKEMTIHLKREEPVIEKRTTSSGQVILKKSSSSESTNIQAQVRSEDVDVAKFGDARNVTISQNVQQSESAAGGAESSGGQASGSSSSTITDPSQLSSGSAQSLVGRSVQFSDVKVQNVVGDRVVVLETDSGRPVYAFSSQGGASSFKPGDTVNLSGTIKSPSSSALSGETAQALNSQRMYIDAQKIESAR